MAKTGRWRKSKAARMKRKVMKKFSVELMRISRRNVKEERRVKRFRVVLDILEATHTSEVMVAHFYAHPSASRRVRGLGRSPMKKVILGLTLNTVDPAVKPRDDGGGWVPRGFDLT